MTRGPLVPFACMLAYLVHFCDYPDDWNPPVDAFQKTHHMQIQQCPECGFESCHATGELQRPTEGDFAVCIECSAILVFRADGSMCATTLAERSKAPDDVLKIVTALSVIGRGGS